MSGRAAVVWPTANPDRNTHAAAVLVDYCQRAGLDIGAFVRLPEGLAMLADGLVDVLVVAHYADLQAAGIHIASEMAGRPMPVRREMSEIQTVPAIQRRPRIVR